LHADKLKHKIKLYRLNKPQSKVYTYYSSFGMMDDRFIEINYTTGRLALMK